MTISETFDLQPGDVIRKPILGGAFTHVGLFIGPFAGVECVMENTPKMGVHCTDAGTFLADLPIGSEIQRYDLDLERQNNLVEYALSLRGMQYDAFSFNCEQFVSLVLTGRTTSIQVRRTLAIGALLALVFRRGA